MRQGACYAIDRASKADFNKASAFSAPGKLTGIVTLLGLADIYCLLKLDDIATHLDKITPASCTISIIYALS